MEDHNKKRTGNNSDRFGVNMKKYCHAHEQYIEEHLQAGDDPAQLLEWHLAKLHMIQHERLVHLIVMIMSILIELGIVRMTFALPDTQPYSAVFMLAWMVLVLFYIAHYFMLENTVQHWYRIADELHEAVRRKKHE